MEKLSTISQSKKYQLFIFQFLVFSFVATDLILDMLKDLPAKSLLVELAIEGSILLLVIVSSTYIWEVLHKTQSSKDELEINLKETKKLASSWERKSKEFIKEFQIHLVDQFEQWNLSKSEQEVALLLLKGNSTKDIAHIRSTSLGTIKNQCSSIYEKSGMPNKNELSAFFLGELLPES